MTTSSLTLLIVDDSPTIGRIIASYFARQAPEYTTHMCTTAMDALSYLAQMPVAGVVTDQALPDLDGISLAGMITAHWPTVPVVLFTGWMSADMATAARMAGCLAVLEKPHGLAELWPTLQSSLSSFSAKEVGAKTS